MWNGKKNPINKPKTGGKISPGRWGGRGGKVEERTFPPQAVENSVENVERMCRSSGKTIGAGAEGKTAWGKAEMWKEENGGKALEAAAAEGFSTEGI